VANILTGFFFYFIDYANFLVKSDALLSPRDFLDYHEKPLDIVLESGMLIK
jgi:hypothetical protein